MADAYETTPLNPAAADTLATPNPDHLPTCTTPTCRTINRIATSPHVVEAKQKMGTAYGSLKESHPHIKTALEHVEAVVTSGHQYLATNEFMTQKIYPHLATAGTWMGEKLDKAVDYAEEKYPKAREDVKEEGKELGEKVKAEAKKDGPKIEAELKKEGKKLEEEAKKVEEKVKEEFKK